MANIKTFKQLKDEAMSWLDQTGAGGTTETVFGSAINQALMQRLTQEPWTFMLRSSSFTTTAGRRTYVLHPEFGRPLYFRNTRTGKYLEEVPTGSLVDSLLDPANETAPAQHFGLWGRSPVAAQPAATGTLSIVSSSTADTTTGLTLTVTYEDANGATRTEELQANGTTAVTTSGSAVTVVGASKSGTTWAGTVTLRDSDGNTLLSLLPAEYARSYQTLELLETPDAGDTIEYRFFVTPRALSEDSDVPQLPPPFTDILIWDALLLYAGYSSEDVSPAAVGIWRANQQRIEAAMYANLQQQNSLGSRPHYIRIVD